VLLGRAVAVLLAGEARPLSEERQGQPLTAAQGGGRTGPTGLGPQDGLAAGTDQHIHAGHDGVLIHQELRSWS